MRHVRRFSIGVLCVFAALGLMSGYRAIVQIYGVEVRAPNALTTGSEIDMRIKSSGRNGVTGTLMLVQGARVETLGVRQVRDNHIGWFLSQSLVPFPVRESLTVIVPAGVMHRFDAGPATIRAVGLGRKQWMRRPPPTVREVPVVLRR